MALTLRLALGTGTCEQSHPPSTIFILPLVMTQRPGQSKLVHHFLEDSAALTPGAPALYAGSWSSYAAINAQANRLAHLLLEAGVKRGDRVAFLLENSLEYVISYYAILKAGAITVALNTSDTAENLSYILNDCGVSVALSNTRHAPKLEASLKLFLWAETAPAGSSYTLLPQRLAGAPADNPASKRIDLDVASIVYTSGSTGRPRGVTLSHLNIVTNTRSIVDYLHLTPADRVIAVLPFYYIYGKSLLNTHFYAGGSVVIENQVAFPNVILKTMQEQEVTGLAGVPSTFTLLLGRSSVRKMHFPHLRYLTQAGGAMAPAVQREVVEVFAPARLYIMYGATEAAARLAYLDPEDLPRKWGSIGKAIPNVELFVADELGRPLEPNREGALVARGANIMQSYWNHPEETAKALKGGLYITGDIGRMDDEGFLYVVGRTRDMIKVGGNRLSAKEVEDVLYEHPEVLEAAVIGVPDEVLGEAVKAFVVLRESATLQTDETLKRFLREHLAPYKVPKVLEVVDGLPKNEAGKIQKLELR